jgi:YbbR domain-containing protein
VLPAGLTLLREPAPVTVTITGLQRNVAAFKRDSIRASIDLSNASAGVNQVPLKLDLFDRTVVIRSAPATIPVELDRLSTVTKKVEVRTTGKPASCCVTGTGLATPDSVTLSGPQSLLQTAVPYVVVDVTDQGVTVQQQPNVQVQANNLPVKGVTAAPTQVAVTVPINNNKLQRNLGIHVVTSGQPAAGYRVIAVEVAPTSVVAEGDPGVLSGAAATVDTETVDISGATTDISRTVGLKPPSGISILTKGAITVKIRFQQDQRVEPNPSPRPSPSPSP